MSATENAAVTPCAASSHGGPKVVAVQRSAPVQVVDEITAVPAVDAIFLTLGLEMPESVQYKVGHSRVQTKLQDIQYVQEIKHGVKTRGIL
jgi:2-keto-3-deoxy-L-rhamnonate aldolase RhmA